MFPLAFTGGESDGSLGMTGELVFSEGEAALFQNVVPKMTALGTS
jgi:hypothetical protein